MHSPDPKDDPLWKDPLNDPRRVPDPVTDPNVNGDQDRREVPTDVEREPGGPEEGTVVPEPEQPTPLSDDRR